LEVPERIDSARRRIDAVGDEVGEAGRGERSEVADLA
jgi:hypothetical protein